jgi:hypothetical protein
VQICECTHRASDGVLFPDPNRPNKCSFCIDKWKNYKLVKDPETIKLASEDKKRCKSCGQTVKKELFERTYFHTIDKEYRKQKMLTCIPCLDSKITGEGLLSAKKRWSDIKVEMMKEKLTDLEATQAAHNCSGCSKDCPCDLKEMRRIFVDKLGQDFGNQVFSAILEW